METDYFNRMLGALFPRFRLVREHQGNIHNRRMTRAEWKCYYHFQRKRRRMLRQDEEEYWEWVKRNL